MIKKSLISESESQKSHQAALTNDKLQTIKEAEAKLENAHLDIIKNHFKIQEARDQLELKQLLDKESDDEAEAMRLQVDQQLLLDSSQIVGFSELVASQLGKRRHDSTSKKLSCQMCHMKFEH
jgi:hypothetical protein